MRIRVAAVAILVLAAGCTARPPGNPDGGPLAGGALEFREHEGAVVGIVVDDELVPLAGANVTLLATGRDAALASSAADGRFQFGRVPEGPYTVIATAAGHEHAARGGAVMAGRIEEIQLVLRALPPEVEPRMDTLAAWEGYIGCSLGLYSFSTVDLCAPADTNSDFELRFPLRKRLNGIHWELHWRATSVLSAKYLSVLWTSPAGIGMTPSNVDPEDHWAEPPCNGKGRTPIARTCLLRQDATNPLWDDNETPAAVQVRAVGNNTLPTANPSRWVEEQSGLVMQQRFTLYATLFYGGLEVPTAFTNGPDS